MHLLRRLALLTLAMAAVHAGDAPPPPNVVIILMDDMGYGDISPFWPQTRNRTPNLERMAAEGMRLTSFYAAPACSPSRAQLLTGCYAKRVGLPQVLMPMSPIGLSSEEPSIGSLLRQQGYATMCIGKWHVGDQPEFLPMRHGFDHYLGLPYSNDMGGNLDGAGAPAGRRPPLALLQDADVIEYIRPEDQDRLTERYTEAAIAFIRANVAKRFFLYLPHTAVHVPLHPGAAFAGRSANGRYGDWVEEADASTGRILETLRELKIDRNTLVIFTSDNGPWLSKGKDAGIAGPLRGGKTETWEGGVRVPTIAWWPGRIAAGATSDLPCGLIDLLPTCVALAKGKLPGGRTIDGVDLSPLLLGTSTAPPHQAYYYFSGQRLQAVRSGAWKLAIAPLGKGQNAAAKDGAYPPRLYNLENDISESNDVAAANPEVVQRLQAHIATMEADLGSSGNGPGVRKPGSVNNPRPLLLPTGP